jgi:hypothetical protein
MHALRPQQCRSGRAAATASTPPQPIQRTGRRPKGGLWAASLNVCPSRELSIAVPRSLIGQIGSIRLGSTAALADDVAPHTGPSVGGGTTPVDTSYAVREAALRPLAYAALAVLTGVRACCWGTLASMTRIAEAISS